VLGNAYVFGKVKKVKLSHYRPGQSLCSKGNLRTPEFLDTRYMKVVLLSALRTGRLYSPNRYHRYLLPSEDEST